MAFRNQKFFKSRSFAENKFKQITLMALQGIINPYFSFLVLLKLTSSLAYPFAAVGLGIMALLNTNMFIYD